MKLIFEIVHMVKDESSLLKNTALYIQDVEEHFDSSLGQRRSGLHGSSSFHTGSLRGERGRSMSVVT